jgi:hypothetical protein
MVDVLNKASFIIMCLALGIGAAIILASMWKARREVPQLAESYAEA